MDRTDGMDVRTDSSDTICAPIENGGGITIMLTGLKWHILLTTIYLLDSDKKQLSNE